MIRIVNFACFAVCALTCLALYHVSDETRVTRAKAAAMDQQIASEQQAIRVLQAEWDRLAVPARIQDISKAETGTDDAPAVELSALTLLPRRGETTPMDSAQLRSASVVVPSDRRGD